MTAPTPRDDVDAAAAELLALQHTDHPLPGWDVTCAVCRLTPAEAFRLGYRAAVAAYRATQDGGAEEADTGAALIAAERRRQVEAEGWTPEHDAEHAGEGLALAACCYALPPQMRKYRNVSMQIQGGVGVATVPTLWPWEPEAWKPCRDGRVRELVKAGALIAAEIDRLNARAALAPQAGDGAR